MKRIITVLALLTLAACGESTPPAATPQAAAPAGPNAADVYRDCFRRFDRDLKSIGLSIQITTERTDLAPGTPFRNLDEAAAVLAERQTVIGALIDAAKMDACDFGLRPGAEGQAAAIDVCTGVRDAARILRADAARLAEAGDTASAAERFAALYGLIAHAADEPAIIVALTNEAVLGLVNPSVIAIATARPPRRFGPDDARVVEAAIARLHADDPAGTVRVQSADPPDERIRASLNMSLTRTVSDLKATRDALAAIR